MRTYRFLFYRIYDWGKRVHGLSDLPELNAISGMSMLATMNVFSIAMSAELAVGRGAVGDNAKFIAVMVWLGFLALHFLYLVRGDRVGRICEEFEEEKPATGATVAVWVYPLASLALFFSLLLVRW